MRLTKIDRYGHFYTNKAYCRNIWSLDGKKLEGEFFENQTLAIDGDAIDKLGQLEDIEEELGIDLIILLKAVKDGIWVRHPYNSIDYEPFRIDYWIDYKTGEEGMMICGMEIKDYGKTWALTKEELENER